MTIPAATDPVPLSDALVYTKYSIDDKSQGHSQPWVTTTPGAEGKALTPPADNCMQPAVSPDETMIAMICRHDSVQSTQLVVASFNKAGETIGQPSVLVAGQLAAVPVFSPDGRTIDFLSPVQTGGPFQLWTVPAAPFASPGAARPITHNVALDSGSAPVWVRG